MANSIDSITSSLQDVDVIDLSTWPSGLKVLASLAIGIIIAYLIVRFFYNPLNDHLSVASNTEITLKKAYKTKQSQAINLTLYQDQMAEIKERFDVVLQQLPNKSEVPSLLLDISQAGIEQGMVFKRFKPDSTEFKSFYARLPIEINASGSYHQIAEFISAIANLQRIVTVGDMAIKRVLNKSNKPNYDPVDPLTFTATIFTYHFIDASALSNQGKNGVTIPRIQ